jgi:hypothetical protein
MKINYPINYLRTVLKNLDKHDLINLSLAYLSIPISICLVLPFYDKLLHILILSLGVCTFIILFIYGIINEKQNI